MYSISICDKEKTRGDKLENLLHCYFTAKKLDFKINRYSTPSEISRVSGCTDIVFMNIDENMDGINAGEALIRSNPDIYLYVLSQGADFLDNAMDIKAFRFFETPINTERLYDSLELIVHRPLQIEFMSNYLSVTLSEAEIVCIRTEDRRTCVITDSGVVYPTTMSMKEWTEKVKECKNYVSPHYSYIVNLKYVSEFDGEVITLRTKIGKTMKIYPSQRKISEFRNRFQAFRQD